MERSVTQLPIRHCEPKAKQPRGRVMRPLGCFVASLLAMTGARRVLGRGAFADYSDRKTHPRRTRRYGELAIGGRFRLLETAPDRIRWESTLTLWKVEP